MKYLTYDMHYRWNSDFGILLKPRKGKGYKISQKTMTYLDCCMNLWNLNISILKTLRVAFAGISLTCYVYVVKGWMRWQGYIKTSIILFLGFLGIPRDVFNWV